MSTTTGTFPGVRIQDMPDLGAVSDTTSFVSEKAGSGLISALALRDYVGTPGNSGVPEAPTDGGYYGRVSATWQLVAPIVSPQITGTPTAPTPPPGTNTAQLATTAFVMTQVGAATGLPEAPTDGRYYGRAGATWQPVAPIVSPQITGTPTAPTASVGTSTTQLATTAFVSGAITAAGSISEAPSDSQYYSRRNAGWAVTPGGLTDAPNDGANYGRRSSAWVTVPSLVRNNTSAGFDLNTIGGDGGAVPYNGFLGLYSIVNQTSPLNFPGGEDTGVILHGFNSNAAWQSQLFMGDNKFPTPRLFYRARNDTAWNPWNQLITDAGGTLTGPLVLAADPTAPLGAATRQYVDGKVGGAVVTASIAALRAQTSATATYIYVQGYYAPGDGGGGDYVRGANGTDNGGSIIVTGNGTFYLQTYGRSVSVLQFGAKGDGTTDDTVACQHALDASLDVVFPARSTGAAATYRLSNSLYPRVGHTVRGAGSGVTTLLMVVAATTIWFGTTSSAKFGNFNISDFTIRSAVGGNIGVVSILYSDVTVRNMVFAGCTTASVHIDGGYNILVENCVSIPHFAGNLKAGGFEAVSTDTSNYCFYPIFRDCRVQTGEIENPGGSTPGAVSPCVKFNRVIGGLIENFIGERLNLPAANSVAGIQIQGDCQGCKIIGGVTFGAQYGVVMFPDSASAAAPGYIVVQNHDVDACGTAGISVNGTASKVCADIIITDCVITAEQLMSAIGITVSQTLRLIIKDNILDQYQFTQTGDGIQISATNMALITGNILTNLHTAFGMVPSCVNTQFTDNILQGNVNNVVGDTSASNTGTNMIRGNTGAYSWTLPYVTPAIPASGVYIQNTTGLDVMVYVYGGNGVTIGVNGKSTGILFSPLGNEPKGGSAFLPANGTIGVNYQTAPTWIWIPV